MAFRSNGPVVLALPPFRGVTREIILAVLGVFFARLVLGIVSPHVAVAVASSLSLHAQEAIRTTPWQLVTYPLMGSGLVGTLFAVLSLWFFGSALEDERGGRWLREYLLVATVGGGLLACVLCSLSGSRLPGLDGDPVAASLWPAVLTLLLAYARFHAEEQLTFNFILRIRAKYLAVLYLLFYLASALIGGDRFGALLGLTNALAGFCFLKLAPQGGIRKAFSERWFALRNSRLQSKRRRAAKKFAVYMREQGRNANIDSDGRYIAPEDLPGGRSRQNESRWTN